MHFSTERLNMRPLKKSDAQQFLCAVENSRKELGEFLPWVEGLQTVQDAARHIEPYILQAELENGALLGIFLNEKLIGALYLHWVSEANESAAIGYWLSTKFTGQGYATESLEAFCKHLLDSGINRIEVHTATSNIKSASLLKRVGFAEEGICREYEKFHEKFVDHYRFSLLKKDFAKNFAAPPCHNP